MLHSVAFTTENVPSFPNDLQGSEARNKSAALKPELPVRSSTLIVIIEDNPGDVFIMEEALREHSVDCSVTVLVDGEQANDFFNCIDKDSTTQCPSLVLLDLNLPKRPGHWVLTRIRNAYRCASVPIVIVSSSEAESDLIANRELGATTYFRKPSNLEEFMKLGAVVSSLL